MKALGATGVGPIGSRWFARPVGRPSLWLIIMPIALLYSPRTKRQSSKPRGRNEQASQSTSLSRRYIAVPVGSRRMTIPHLKLRNAARRLWLYSPERREAKRRAKAGAGYWRCEKCGAIRDKVEINHRWPCGPTPGSRKANGATWDGFFARLFCPSDGLEIVCHECHLEITANQRLVSTTG